MENLNPNFGYTYPRPAVATDCVVFYYDLREEILKVLLIERKNDPFKDKYALPGGFLKISAKTNEQGLVVEETNESLMECALRELKEETGLRVKHIENLGTWSNPGRDPRCITISDAYLALTTTKEIKAGDDAKTAKWVPLNQVLNTASNMPEGMRFLAFDHDQIVAKAYQHLQQQVCFQPIAFDLLPHRFSMTCLQRLYEAILDREFDRRNFSRKMLDANVLDAYPTEGRMIYYSLNPQKYNEFLRRGKISNLIF